MLIGFFSGLGLGYARAYFLESPDLTEAARWMLAFQIALASVALALVITNYLEFRQRVLKRVQEKQEQK